VGFIIPSGNLGHAMACTWAKELGFPICDIILAHNANHSMVDYFTTGKYSPSPTVSTLANAMDVGNPSNAERLLNFKSYEELKTFISAISVSDVQIQQTIAEGLDRWHEVWCPHTACAVNVRQHLSKGDWIIVATAHPAKFETVVEPLIRKSLDVPDQLQQLLFKPSKYTSIQPDIESFLKSL
jgi:threonine synthase